jgi:hypothetical protein
MFKPLSRFTPFEDSRPNVFNTYAQFDYITLAVKSRIDVVTSRTEREVKFVHDLNATLATIEAASESDRYPHMPFRCHG